MVVSDYLSYQLLAVFIGHLYMYLYVGTFKPTAHKVCVWIIIFSLGLMEEKMLLGALAPYMYFSYRGEENKFI